ERLIARNGDQDRAIAPALQHLELGQVLRYAFRQAVHQYGRLRYRYLEARPGRPHDEPAVDRLDAVLGRKRVLALPLAQHIRPPPAGLQPELPKLAQEVVLVPRLHADEVHVVLRDARAEPVFGGHAVSLRELGHPADQRLVGGAQRIFDRRARADHHDHSVILPVERVVVPRRVVDGPVALPELADVTDERKPARRVVPDVGGVLGRAVHEIPFREGEERLIAATPVLFGRNGGRPSGKDRGAEGEREETADRPPTQDAFPSHAARSLTKPSSTLSVGSCGCSRRLPMSRKPAACSRRDHSATVVKCRRSLRFSSHGTPRPALNTVCARQTNLSIWREVTS